ncbi:MAG: GTP 3',8-cyclase MoaA [Planctomycetota bacterium]
MTLPPLLDLLGRPLRNLRLSVTDRCNLRCQYCMPHEAYRWLPRADLLHYGEMSALVDLFLDLGVTKIRLTGGEPLLRRDLPRLVEQLARRKRIQDLAMTTNGQILAEAALDLKLAGLHRVTVSLDTLRPERFERMSRSDSLGRTLAGIEQLGRVGFQNTRIDTVVIRGTNDDEIPDLIEFGRQVGAEVRFIEYMDVGGATGWSLDQVQTRDAILAEIETRFGKVQLLEPASLEESAAPANRYRLADGTVFGIVASTTAPFCGTCNRSRLTADGTWYHCLYAAAGIDLKSPFREGLSNDDLKRRIVAGWTKRANRGAEERLELKERSSPHNQDNLREDPRLEMHTRGG